MAALLTGSTAAEAARTATQPQQTHRVAIEVSTHDPALFELALNNAVNISREFSEAAGDVELKIVAYGLGLHMFRAETSPVTARIRSVSQSIPGIVLSACGNTITAMKHAEGRKVELLPGVRVVKAGAVRLVRLQEAGWS